VGASGWISAIENPLLFISYSWRLTATTGSEIKAMATARAVGPAGWQASLLEARPIEPRKRVILVNIGGSPKLAGLTVFMLRLVTTNCQHCQVLVLPEFWYDAVMVEKAVGRRERKKRETSEAIQAAARRLFAAQGYAVTTVQQIADEADISERTLFRYFESKEDLLLPDVVDFFGAVESAIRARPIDETPLKSIFEALAEVTDRSGLGPIFESGPVVDPVAASRLVKVLVEWEDRLSDVLLDRFVRMTGTAPTQLLTLRASVVARAAVSGMRATIRIVQFANASGSPATDTAETLQEAFAVLGAGCSNPLREQS
jgi:AcrR family transcriptional regulator